MSTFRRRLLEGAFHRSMDESGYLTIKNYYWVTDIAAASDVDIEVKFKCTNASYRGIFGSRVAMDNEKAYFLADSEFYYNGSRSSLGQTWPINTILICKKTGNSVTITSEDGQTSYGSCTLSGTFSGGANMGLGTFMQAATSMTAFYGDIYYFKIWSNGTLVRDYYPRYKVSASTFGFLDKVGGSFLTPIKKSGLGGASLTGTNVINI